METWRFNHPEHGLIEVERGYDEEFLHLYEDWPQEIPTDKEGNPKSFREPQPDDGFLSRTRTYWKNPRARMQIKVNGQPYRRLSEVPGGRVPLSKHIGDELSTPISVGLKKEKPHLKFLKSAADEVLSIEYRDADSLVEFDPPEETRARKRYEAMESSNLKRFFIPLGEGLAKGGWAILAPILILVINPIMEWLSQFLPEFPDLPDFPSPPSINLPVVHPPQIDLPVITWPSWSFPEAPEWVIWMMENTKIWMPVVIGLIIGITALRNHGRSEKTKKKWQEDSQA